MRFLYLLTMRLTRTARYHVYASPIVLAPYFSSTPLVIDDSIIALEARRSVYLSLPIEIAVPVGRNRYCERPQP
jgi:hypothetical protein